MVADERRGHQTGKPLPDQNRTKGGLPAMTPPKPPIVRGRARQATPSAHIGYWRILEQEPFWVISFLPNGRN